MEGRPRDTTHGEHQADSVGEAFETAWADPEIHACWADVFLKLPAVLKPLVERGTAPHLLSIEPEIWAMFAPLISLLQERVPVFKHGWESRLYPWICAITVDVVAPEIGIPIPGEMARILPDNPAAVTAEGKFTFTGEESDDPRYNRWTREVRNYFRSLRPEGTVGRRKKSQADKPSKTGSRSLDPELAKLAFNMSQRGAHWKEIARACYPHFTPSQIRTNAMSKHIDRLRVRGGRYDLWG